MNTEARPHHFEGAVSGSPGPIGPIATTPAQPVPRLAGIAGNARWFAFAGSTFLAALLALSGCGAKETKSDSAAAETPPAAEGETAAAEEAPAAEESTTDTLVIQQMNVGETLDASDKAVKGKDWQGATDNLLKLQLSGSLKTDADSWQYNRRMTVLQDQLLEAAENGDAKAKAAIDLLRKSRRVR